MNHPHILGQRYTPQELTGRNYAHYTHGTPDDAQPFEVDCQDLPLDLPEEPLERDSAADTLRREVLPPDCWVKRLSAADAGEDGFYLLALTLDPDGAVSSLRTLREHICGSNRSWISFPGTDAISVSTYQILDELPAPVERELQGLERRRFLPLTFSLEGRPYPAALSAAGDDSYACPSAWRQAWTLVELERDGPAIESLAYSTHPATGDAWGDMCSRPRCLLDLYEESVDALVWLIDRYSDEEYAQFLAETL